MPDNCLMSTIIGWFAAPMLLSLGKIER